MLKFEIDYTDGDWPYSVEPEIVKHFETVEEAEKWCDEKSIRRDRYSIKKIDGIPYYQWKRENE